MYTEMTHLDKKNDTLSDTLDIKNDTLSDTSDTH